MNKKGYTLVELLAIVAILGIISVISAPSILRMVDNNKKDEMLQDAVTLISRAKVKISGDREFRNSDETIKTYTMSNLVEDDELVDDPDGGQYNRTASFVSYDKDTGRYCILLRGSKRAVANKIGATLNCAYEDQLYSRNSVVDND